MTGSNVLTADRNGNGHANSYQVKHASLSELANELRTFVLNDNGNVATVLEKLGQAVDANATEEIQDALVLIAVFLRDRCKDKDRVLAILDRHPSRNLAPAAVQQGIERLLKKHQDDPGKVQELRRFLAAFDLIAGLKTIPNAQTISQIAEVSAEHLAGADFLASQGKTAEKVIDSLLFGAGGSLRPEWSIAQKLDPYAAEILQRLLRIVPRPLPWWKRWQRTVIISGVVVAAILLVFLTVRAWSKQAPVETPVSAAAPKQESSESVPTPPPVVVEAPPARLTQGKRIVVILAVEPAAGAGLALENRIHTLLLVDKAKGEEKEKDKKADNEKAKIAPKPAIVKITPYSSTHAARVLPAAAFNVKNPAQMIQLVHKEGMFEEADAVLLVRQLQTTAGNIQLTAELVDLTHEVAVLWTGLWQFPHLLEPSTSPDTATVLRAQIRFSQPDQDTLAMMAAEALLARSVSADDHLLAASIYLKNRKEFQPRAHAILLDGFVRFPTDERIARLLFAIETEFNRQTVLAQRTAQLAETREHERFLAANGEHRETILKSWVNSILQGAVR